MLIMLAMRRKMVVISAGQGVFVIADLRYGFRQRTSLGAGVRAAPGQNHCPPDAT